LGCPNKRLRFGIDRLPSLPVPQSQRQTALSATLQPCQNDRLKVHLATIKRNDEFAGVTGEQFLVVEKTSAVSVSMPREAKEAAKIPSILCSDGDPISRIGHCRDERKGARGIAPFFHPNGRTKDAKRSAALLFHTIYVSIHDASASGRPGLAS